MTEEAVVFGAAPGLVGVVTDPAAGSRRGQGVLVLNAGFLHRIGPVRLHVQICRALADAGFTALRFDFSGQGDSGARTDDVSYELSTVMEARAAMDFLRSTRGLTEFVLMGICSGADAAFRTAQQDERVAGLVMIECFAFETPGYEVDRRLRQLTSVNAWRRRLRSWTERGRVPATPAESAEAAAPGGSVWTLPPAGQVRAGMQAVLARGTRACFIFSSEGPSYYHYRRRLRRLVSRIAGESRVDVRLIDRTDHTFTQRSRQAWLLRQITDWSSRLPARMLSEPE